MLDDDADTKENLENRLSRREVRCPQRTSKPYRFCRFVGTGAAPACFHGFSCCDASLRHEGCFFSVAGLSKFTSEQAGYGEETTGVALASQQGFYWFLLQ